MSAARSLSGVTGEHGAAPWNAALVDAARFERDRRIAIFAERQGDHALDVEAATIDCQCWVAIAAWLETDRFLSFSGGAEPQSPASPWISWLELETAAAAALAAVKNDDVRRARLVCIHRKVQLRRESIDAINAEFHKPRGEIAA